MSTWAWAKRWRGTFQAWGGKDPPAQHTLGRFELPASGPGRGQESAFCRKQPPPHLCPRWCRQGHCGSCPRWVPPGSLWVSWAPRVITFQFSSSGTVSVTLCWESESDDGCGTAALVASPGLRGHRPGEQPRTEMLTGLAGTRGQPLPAPCPSWCQAACLPFRSPGSTVVLKLRAEGPCAPTEFPGRGVCLTVHTCPIRNLELKNTY